MHSSNLVFMKDWKEENQKKTILHFATSHVEDTANMWKKVLRSNETKIKLIGLISKPNV